jgi:hypothetical protein
MYVQKAKLDMAAAPTARMDVPSFLGSRGIMSSFSEFRQD